MKRLLVLVLLLSACSPATGATPSAPSAAAGSGPITLKPGDPGPMDFAGGRYAISWDATGCQAFKIEIAPTNGGSPIPIVKLGSPIDAAAATGSATVEVPPGPAYVNRGGVCEHDYTVTLERLP